MMKTVALIVLISILGCNANPIMDEAGEVMEMIARAYESYSTAGCMNYSAPGPAKIFQYCFLESFIGQELLPQEKPRDAVQKVRDMVNCTMRYLGVFNPDGSLNQQAMADVGKKFPSQGNQEDIKFVGESFMTCHQKSMQEGGDMVDIGVGTFKCQTDAVQEECQRRGHPKDIKLVLLSALYSLAIPNHDCDGVQIPKKMEKMVESCLEEDKNSYNFVDEVMPIVFEVGMSIVAGLSRMLEEFKKIPEWKCSVKVAEQEGFVKDGRLVAENLRDAVADFSGWKNDEIKDQITSQLYECLKDLNVGDIFSNSPQTNKCFMPVMTDVCGYNNDLSTQFLYGGASSKFMGSMKNRIINYFGDSQFKEKLTEKLTNMVSMRTESIRSQEED